MAEMMDEAEQLLQSTFGYPSFRPSQLPILRRLLVEHRSALAITPTGGGKSLCYQIPGIVLEGLTIVISPLLSLMKDQVDVLQRKGVKADSLDSAKGAEEAARVREGVRSGELKLLYVAPERLNNEGFIRLIEGKKVSLLAVDEAHCVSEWGPSFRPDYLKVARFAKEINAERVLALTATATRSVEADICKGFDIDPKEGVFRTPIFRENLHIEAVVASTLDDKLNMLVPRLKGRKGPAIVYVTLQKQAEQVMTMLKGRGVTNCEMYHAGMAQDKRKQVQDWFMASKDGVVCATIAFAMGIDKNNIRQIHHLMMPKAIEAWTQEIGRAGRDGLVSDCCLYLCPTDLPVLEGFAMGDACSKKSLADWLGAVMSAERDDADTIYFNQTELSNTYDIRVNMLNILFAILELDYGLLRARTPFYEIYNIQPKSPSGWQQVEKDTSAIAVEIRKSWKKKSKNTEINVVATAHAGKIQRSAIAGQISEWEKAGNISVVASQVRVQFRVLRPRSEMPQSPEELEALAIELVEMLEKREQGELRRMKDVIGVATGERCFAVALADYFGDKDCVPKGACGHCSFCKTGKQLEFSPSYRSPDSKALDEIAKVCGIRDDPRALARFAFGIASPRLTKMGLTRHALFGSCIDADWHALLAQFEAICERAGWTNVAGTEETRKSVPAKRPAPGGANGGAAGGYRGGGFKRGRGK